MPNHTPATPADQKLGLIAPALFVVLWSSGFIGAKLGLPHAEPLTFLAIRFWLASGLLLAITLLFRAPWPKSWREAGHIAVIGLLIHGGYLSGVFFAIHLGAPAGIAALITGLQPILTAIAAGPWLGERVGMRGWVGLLLGLFGVWLVVSDKMTGMPDHVTAILSLSLATVAISAGTLYQKKFASHMGMRSGSTIQFIAAAVPVTGLAFLFEDRTVDWTGEFIFALGWLVLVLSLGAISLLLVLIRKGVSFRVASLFYLTPPTTAIIAYFVFGETLGPVALVGFAVTVVAVALVVTEKKA